MLAAWQLEVDDDGLIFCLDLVDVCVDGVLGFAMTGHCGAVDLQQICQPRDAYNRPLNYNANIFSRHAAGMQ